MVKNGHETKRNKKKQQQQKWNNPIIIKRRDGVILNRLRIGHTHFTHAHLMRKEPPFICQTCGYPTAYR